MKELAIGIDFGTTKTLVSYFSEERGRPEIIRLGRGRDYLPTSVYASDEGDFLFGEDADDQVEWGAEKYCKAFKMKLGSPSPALAFFDENRLVQYSAKELTRLFLLHIKERCEKEVFMGGKISRAVITKPVLFSPVQCEELKKAAEEAGFSEIEFVTEPEAAGYAFCTLCPAEAFKGNALVIDWGGGTLDMALVSRDGSRVSTYREHTAGDTQMGGEVFDDELWNHVVTRLKEIDGTDLVKETPEHQSLLLRRVRDTKEMLSTQTQQTLRLSSSKGSCSPVNLKREEFEQIISIHVEKAVGIANQLIGAIQAKAMKPELLLLVGGSSLVPFISVAMEQTTGLPCKKWQFSREAVSLGAALFALPREGLASMKQADVPSLDSTFSTKVNSVHILNLTTIEMSLGCIKSIESQGKKLEVSIPPGVTSETRLCLPSEKTQGMGALELQIKLLMDGGAKEKPLYMEGLEYLHGINGHRIDYEKAANIFIQGYKNGDWNAAYMLCYCYKEGCGVPIDSTFALKVAGFLIEHNYFPAYRHLFEAWEKGIGVPMDQQKAKDFSNQLELTCFQSIEGIDEIFRYDALIYNELLKKNLDIRELERLTRLNASVSNLPVRFGLLALSLMKDAENSPSARKEIRQLLDEGCEQGDLMSYVFKGSILCGEDTSIFTPNRHQGMKLLQEAASLGDAAALFKYALEIDNPTLAEQTLNQFWKTCKLGLSCFEGVNELNCSIRIAQPPCACGWRVYERNIMVAFLEKERWDQLIIQFLPLLVLKNENSHALHNVKVRICCWDKQLDRTIEVPSALLPGQELEINPMDYDLDLGESLYVEVYSGSRYSRMELGNVGGLSSFVHDSAPPLEMWWERGTFGGYILCVGCKEGKIRIVVKKSQGADIKPVCLQVGQDPARIGWVEFSDSKSLEVGDAFCVESDQYPPIFGIILTTPDDLGRAGGGRW